MIALSGRARQRVLGKRAAYVVVEMDEASTVTVSGTIGIPPLARVSRFRPVTKQVGRPLPGQFQANADTKGCRARSTRAA